MIPVKYEVRVLAQRVIHNSLKVVISEEDLGKRRTTHILLP